MLDAASTRGFLIHITSPSSLLIKRAASLLEKIMLTSANAAGRVEEGKRHLRTLEEHRHEVNERQKRCCSGSDAHHPGFDCSPQLKTKSRASEPKLPTIPKSSPAGGKAGREGGVILRIWLRYFPQQISSACQDEPVM